MFKLNLMVTLLHETCFLAGVVAHDAPASSEKLPYYIFFFFFFFLIWVLRPFQVYFTYIEPIIHRRWAKTGEPGEKPPDHP